MYAQKIGLQEIDQDENCFAQTQTTLSDAIMTLFTAQIAGITQSSSPSLIQFFFSVPSLQAKIKLTFNCICASRV